jgi:hypothetical protein
MTTTFASKLDLIRACRKSPNVVLKLDAGDGWYSLWVLDGKCKHGEPRSLGLFNPQGTMV